VNIGIELVADTKILFLDEPTSGLDSTTATNLIKNLKSIARRRQMTTVSVIHGPSLSAFLELDDLFLLGKGGQVVYHGPVKEAPAYFGSIGFPVPPDCNPADFYLDVISGLVVRIGHENFQPSDLFELWSRHCHKNEFPSDKSSVATMELEQGPSGVAPVKNDESKEHDVLVAINPMEIEKAGMDPADNVYVNPGIKWVSIGPTLTKFAMWIYDFWEDYVFCLFRLFFESVFIYTSCKPDPIRDTPGMYVCLFVSSLFDIFIIATYLVSCSVVL